jgi:hypothetical protein
MAPILLSTPFRFSRMKQVLFFISAVFFLSANGVASGEPISTETLMSLSKEEVEAHWKKSKIPGFFARINNGIEIMEITYGSVMPDGTPTTASGLLFIPRGYEKGKSTLLVYHHGTDLEKARPLNLKGEQTICMVFAADGYLVLMPDYFGLGKGPGMHPYQHAETEAQSSIDMIRAVRQLREKLSLDFNEKIFLTGYSQGGHAAMSAHKFITERHKDEFKIWASAPMSGAYDMTGAQSEAMYREYSHPGYLPYLVFGYNTVYRFFDNPSELFRAPYDTLLPPLFDGKNGMGKVNKIMPKVPKDVFRDEVITAYERDENFSFRRLLAENNVHDWKAEEPVLLCYCQADEQVYYKNSLSAHKAMKARGSKSVKLRHAGRKFNHNQCAVYSSIYTKYWFDSFRRGSRKGRKGNPFKLFLLELNKPRVLKGN